MPLHWEASGEETGPSLDVPPGSCVRAGLAAAVPKSILETKNHTRPPRRLIRCGTMRSGKRLGTAPGPKEQPQDPSAGVIEQTDVAVRGVIFAQASPVPSVK